MIESIIPILQATTVEFTTISPSIFDPLGGSRTLGSFKELLAVAAVAFFFINIIRYMLANAFSDDQGIMKAKSEIMDNFVVALLIIGIWTMLQATEYVSAIAYPAYFTNGPSGFLDSYVIPQITSNMVTTHTLASFQSKKAASKISSIMKSVSILGIPIGGAIFNFFGYNEINKLLFESELNANISIALSIALSAMHYIKDGAGYFLLIGLAARAIPPFRGAGAFLIALGLGFYYIYPLSTAMFLFGIPKITLDQTAIIDLQQAFCTMKATGAIIIPGQDLSSGFEISLGVPQTLEEDFGIIVGTNFLLSQAVALSLTAMFISNATLILGKGLYTSVNITQLLGKVI